MHLTEFSGQWPPTERRMARLTVLVLLLTAGCLQMRGGEKTVRVTMNENGSSITLHRGDVLEVALPASFGTGYSWKIENKTGNVLKASGEPETAPGEKGNQPGQSETQVFRFVTSGEGTAQLEMHYVRPWEKEEKPTKTFSLKVEVK
jgi:inhibitor of cysteine peptidase